MLRCHCLRPRNLVMTLRIGARHVDCSWPVRSNSATSAPHSMCLTSLTTKTKHHLQQTSSTAMRNDRVMSEWQRLLCGAVQQGEELVPAYIVATSISHNGAC